MQKCDYYHFIMYKRDLYNHIINYHAVPAIPILRSAIRISGPSARINWIPLTPDEARGLLTSLEITYEPAGRSGCFGYDFTESGVIRVRGNLFEQNTTNITGLEPNREYCVAIQVSTNGGDSGFSNIVNLPCKLYLIPIQRTRLILCIPCTHMQCQKEPHSN